MSRLQDKSFWIGNTRSPPQEKSPTKPRTRVCLSRIIELFQLDGTLKGHLVQPLQWRGTPTVGSGAQSPIPPNLECIHGWDIHLSGLHCASLWVSVYHHCVPPLCLSLLLLSKHGIHMHRLGTPCRFSEMHAFNTLLLLLTILDTWTTQEKKKKKPVSLHRDAENAEVEQKNNPKLSCWATTPNKTGNHLVSIKPSPTTTTVQRVQDGPR